MKDAYEVLRRKEAELARIRHEITSLKIVAPLLSDDALSDPSQKGESVEEDVPDGRVHSAATGTEDMFSFASVSRPKIWDVLKRGK
jgi:hypothetical protein